MFVTIVLFVCAILLAILCLPVVLTLGVIVMGALFYLLLGVVGFCFMIVAAVLAVGSAIWSFLRSLLWWR